MLNPHRAFSNFRPAKALLLAGSSLSMLAMSQTAMAQSDDNEVVVTGIRQVIQDSIKLKREATSVVDGLSADEIGDLPALSIAEALEQIASIGSQREGSGATEVSIRGLGPFLGSTVINGREATNGSGDRSVNFSQFPSELFNKIEVYKTQEASLIEGGVAGQIALSTLKPLEYGKRRFQLQAKGNVQPDNLDIDNRARTVGYRLTGSYVDQWESNTLGQFGLSIGGQIQRRPNSEQEARTGSPQACVISANAGTPDEVGVDGSSCNATGFNAEGQDINPVTGARFGVADDLVLTSSSASFRQNVTDDARDSVFGAVQWQPNERLDINADVQYSDRTFTEFRSDLVIDRNDIEEAGTGDFLPVSGFDLTTTDTGAFRTATTSGDVQSISQFSEREEEYIGFGGNISYDVTERLNLSVDGAFSDTSRRENQIQARVASGAQLVGVEIFQDGSDGPQFTLLDFDVNDTSLFVNDNVELREDLNQFRNHQIWAVKGDAEYALDTNFFSAFKAGARYSVQDYDQLPRVRNEFEVDDNSDFLDGAFASSIGGAPVVATIELDVSTGAEGDLADALMLQSLLDQGLPAGFVPQVFDGQLTQGLIPVDINGVTEFAAFSQDGNGDFDVTATAAQFVALGFGNDGNTDTPNEGFTNLGTLAAAACANPSFAEPDFLNGEISGNLITNIDSDGNVIAAGTGRSFLTFDSQCLQEAVAGRTLAAPSASSAGNDELIESVDVEEETIAFYGQLDFDTEFDGLPLRGNVGLRYVDTTLTSRGFTSSLDVDVDPETGFVTGVPSGGGTGVLVPITSEFSYTELLPSLNAVLEVRDDVLVRGGVFRAISRADPADLGIGREFDINDGAADDEDITLQDVIDDVDANGNPFLEPFTSWNYDLAVEWYPNEDSILAVGAYYKVFNGGFETAFQPETFTINGVDSEVLVQVPITTDENSTIFGIEVTAGHAFTYLPGLLSGVGFNVSYNYADSDFETEDGQFGESITLDENGEILETLPGFVVPANLQGLSEHTANGRVYWNVGDATFTGIGKYRSSFFQPFVDNGADLRFIDGAFVLDARFSYKINKNLKFSLEGTNLLNTARNQFRTTTDNFGELNVFGPRYFAGITAKF